MAPEEKWRRVSTAGNTHALPTCIPGVGCGQEIGLEPTSTVSFPNLRCDSLLVRQANRCLYHCFTGMGEKQIHRNPCDPSDPAPGLTPDPQMMSSIPKRRGYLQS